MEGTPNFVFANKLKALKVNLKNGMDWIWECQCAKENLIGWFKGA